MIEIRNPSYAYMWRKSGARRPRTRLPWERQRASFGGYAPIGSARASRDYRPSDEELQILRTQGEEAQQRFDARLSDVERRHGDLLRALAAEVTRTGAATVRTTSGDIEARIIRFRRGAVVLEIDFPGGCNRSQSSMETVERSAVRQLASALASTRPDAEPLGGVT